MSEPEPFATLPDGVQWGMWLPNFQTGGSTDGGAVTDQEGALGARLSIVHWYASDTESWEYDGSIVNSVLNGIGPGRTPMITWEFDNHSLGSIASGGADAYLSSWAAGAAAYAPNPIYIRIFHEFNDPLEPAQDQGYAWGVCGGTDNQPSDLVAAWRHIVTVFRGAGASNVKFVWNPDGTFNRQSMYEGADCAPLSAAFPGDSYVDFIGFDDYDYDTRALYSIITAVSSRPLILGEIGTTDASGGPGFIGDFARGFGDGSYSRIRAILYWNEEEYQLAFNPATAAAIRSMLSTDTASARQAHAVASPPSPPPSSNSPSLVACKVRGESSCSFP